MCFYSYNGSCHFSPQKQWKITIYLDANGNPVTESVQSVAVTDASGNPVTGIDTLRLL